MKKIIFGILMVLALGTTIVYATEQPTNCSGTNPDPSCAPTGERETDCRGITQDSCGRTGQPACPPRATATPAPKAGGAATVNVQGK